MCVGPTHESVPRWMLKYLTTLCLNVANLEANPFTVQHSEHAPVHPHSHFSPFPSLVQQNKQAHIGELERKIL